MSAKPTRNVFQRMPQGRMACTQRHRKENKDLRRYNITNRCRADASRVLECVHKQGAVLMLPCTYPLTNDTLAELYRNCAHCLKAKEMAQPWCSIPCALSATSLNLTRCNTTWSLTRVTRCLHSFTRRQAASYEGFAPTNKAIRHSNTLGSFTAPHIV